MKFSKRTIYIVLLIGISLLHLSYLPNGFTWFDHTDIELGRTIVPLSSWYNIFITRFGQTGFYRPLVSLLHSIDYDTYSSSAIGFHMTNVLLHIGVVMVTPFFLSVFFNLTYKEQLLSMLIVGIAPVNWLTVGGISFRYEMLYVLFTMLALYWYVPSSTEHRYSIIKNIIIFGLFVLYAFFSHESALVMVPLLIIVWELWNRSRAQKVIESRMLNITAVVICYFIYFILRLIAIPEVWNVKILSLNFSEALGTRLVAIGKLLVQILSPFLPQFSDASTIFQIYHIFSVLTIIVIVISILYIFRYGIQSVGSRVILLFWISILPAFNIIPMKPFYSPVYGYFASVFLAMIFVLIFKTVIPMKIVPGVIVIWIIIASYSTFTGGYRFKNDLTLFTPEVTRDDNFLEGHHYMGDYYLFHGFISNATKEYERALQENKYVIADIDRTLVLNNLAALRVQQNRLKEADSILATIQKQQGAGGSLGIRYNRALIAYKQKDYKKVVDLLFKSYKQWRRPEPLLLLSDSLKKSGRVKESKEVLERLRQSSRFQP